MCANRFFHRSIGYSNECLGLHWGNIHKADLGDGNGRTSEMYLARQAYFPIWGTCWESVAGGHHFRAWRQNGTHADSGAWFIGCVYHPLPSRWPRCFFFLRTPLFIFTDGHTYTYARTKCTERRRSRLLRSGTRFPRMGTTSAETGL